MARPARFAASLRRAVAGALLLGVLASPTTGFDQTITAVQPPPATRPAGASDRAPGAAGPLLRPVR
jgi:hypothetical protein